MFLCLLAEIETKFFLEWKTSLPAWSIALFVAFFLGWVYWCYKYETASSSLFLKASLGVLRVLILLGLFAIFCEPVIHEETSKTRKSNLVFMIDSSLSMNIKDHYQSSEEIDALSRAMKADPRTFSEINRIEIVNQVLSQSEALNKLQEECDLKFFKFDGDISLMPSFSPVKPSGQKTDIYQNLIKSIDFFRGRSISGVFLLSDGQHNTSPNAAKQEQSIQQAILHATQRDVPIYTVGVGSTNKKRDIVLASVEAPEVALLDDKIRFELELRNVGYEGQSVPIYLKWGDTIIAEATVTLGKEDAVQKTSIAHSFNMADDYNITVTVPEQTGEFTRENNSRQHTIKVIQQKLQVLYLEDSPRWEYRYLKNALIRDETVIANTWLYSADSSFPQEKSKLASSLSGFPDKEQLFKYHCVILGDVSPHDLGEEKMKLLVEFVKEVGGGVAFIAGTQYNPAEYWDTPLYPLLPIVVDNLAQTEEHKNELRRIRLSHEGKQHPIMRLLSESEENINLWENRQHGLPGFYWAFPINKAKPGSTILAVHESTGRPLMATQFYGKGKTFFTALDSSWRWRYLEGDRYFYRFWGQVIRHVSMGLLVGGDRQYFLRVENLQYAIGEKVNIILRVREAQKRNVSMPKEWEVNYLMPGGEEKTKKLLLKENETDTYEGTIIATRIGTYKVWFKPEDSGKEIGTFFNVLPPVAETGNTELNVQDLKKLAVETQGEFCKPYELEKVLTNLKPKKDILPGTKREYPYWDDSWIFLILIAMFTLEWVLRKSFRML